MCLARPAPPSASDWSAPICSNGICPHVPVNLIWENGPLRSQLSRDSLVFSGSTATLPFVVVVEKLLELRGKKAPGLCVTDTKSESTRSGE